MGDGLSTIPASSHHLTHLSFHPLLSKQGSLRSSSCISHAHATPQRSCFLAHCHFPLSFQKPLLGQWRSEACDLISLLITHHGSQEHAFEGYSSNTWVSPTWVRPVDSTTPLQSICSSFFSPSCCVLRKPSGRFIGQKAGGFAQSHRGSPSQDWNSRSPDSQTIAQATELSSSPSYWKPWP